MSGTFLVDDVRVVLEDDSFCEFVAIDLLFGSCGSMYDDKHGECALLVEILDAGTKTQGLKKFHSKLEQRAISIDVSATKENIMIEVVALKEHANFAINSLVELLSDPNISDDEIKKAKLVLASEYLGLESDYKHVSKRTLEELILPKDLARGFLPKPDELESVSASDLEQKIKKVLNTKNMFIGFGGGIDKDFCVKSTKKITSCLSGARAQRQKRVDLSSQPQYKSVAKNTNQAFVSFGSAFSHENSQEHFSSVASFIVGGSGFGSRLMEEVRVKRGFAYSVYARFNVYKSYACFSGALQTSLENEKKAIELTKKIVEEFIKKGARKDELTKAKKFILGSEPLRNEKMSQRLKTALIDVYMGKKHNYSKEILKKIQEMELKSLNNFLRTHEEVLALSFGVVNKG